MPRKKTGKTDQTKKTRQDHQNSIIEATLHLAAQKGWSMVTLRDIAAHSGVRYADLRSHFSSKDDILDRFTAMIDARLAETIDPESAGAPIRERLFELLMIRFDLLTEYKESLRAIINGAIADPFTIAPGLMRLNVSMRWTLEIAGISVSGMRGFLRVQFLSAAFLAALRAWLRDDSPDMAMTMATIDRWINRAEDLEHRLCPRTRHDHGDTMEPHTRRDA